MPPAASRQFPGKLHQILEDAETEGFEDIISWSPTGLAFRIHDKARFANDLMEKYWTTSNWKSMQVRVRMAGWLAGRLTVSRQPVC